MTAAHRRHNPLTDEWVLVSPGRTKRPWLGRTESMAAVEPPPYDPGCYLCPTNERMSGDTNPAFESTFVFTNDFAALQPDVEPIEHEGGLLRTETQQGTCRVVCYSPRHDLRLSLMTTAEIESVINMWSEQTAELGERYRWVQVFENKKLFRGASNPHPHHGYWA